MAATLTLSELAPEGAGHFSLANEEINLGDGAVETDSYTIIDNALAHPWINVEFPKVDVDTASLDQADAPYPGDLRVNSLANDPEAVAAAEAEKREQVDHPLAVDAGLDQNEPVVTSGVAETLAVEEALPDDTAPEDNPFSPQFVPEDEAARNDEFAAGETADADKETK